jgi:ribonuclease P protein component
VTRSLLKRQIRAAVLAQGEALSTGLWVIRLRAPFDVAQFPSAHSQALRNAARDELDLLLTSAVQRGRGR